MVDANSVNTSVAAQRYPRAYLVLSVLLVLVGLAFRMFSLQSTPLFFDEMAHINRAHRIAQGEVFTGMDHNKWLYVVTVALFKPLGPDGPWIARAVSALMAALTMAAVISLGRKLDRPCSGLIAGLIYALLPMAIFHERQALHESQLTALTTISLLLALHQARKATPATTVALGLVLAAAHLTKASAIPFLTIPFAATFLLHRGRRWPGRRLLLHSAASVALALAIIVPIRLIANQSGYASFDSHAVGGQNLFFLHHTLQETTARFWEDMRALSDVWTTYIGWAAVVPAALIMVWLIRGQRWREILYLSVPSLLYLALPLVAIRPGGGGLLYPRYVSPNVAPLIVLLGLSLSMLTSQLDALMPRVGGWLSGFIVAGMIVQALAFNLALLRDPLSVHLTANDERQYRGYFERGIPTELTEYLLSRWSAGDGRPIRVLGGPEHIWLTAYMGPRTIETQCFNREEIYIEPWFGAGDQVYFMDGTVYGQEWKKELVTGAVTEYLGTFTIEGGTLDLSQLVRAESTLAERIYADRISPPRFMADDLQALADSFEPLPEDRTIYVVPVNYAEPLAELTELSVEPMHVPFPPEDDIIKGNVPELEQVPPDTRVDVVMVDPDSIDPDRALVLELQEHHYLLDEKWIGHLNYRRFVSGPSSFVGTPVRAEFEDSIALEALVIDQAVSSGGPVRVTLTWMASHPIHAPFKVFLHIVNHDDAILVQRDAIPGSGLLPMTAWMPNQAISDRFAVTIPQDGTSGMYEVRLGIYDPDTGQRLRVTGGPGAGQDYAVIGHLLVGTDS